ncbi:MAG: type II toxin-antitoxin system RelE/ParE family toxin [Chloroflexi bacterium]|nr:type II toxin-antitoxin system RelE/ParE family toxin [Chloroflexota bacterium]
MTYTVRLARQAERYLERLPQDVQRRMLERLGQLAHDPYGVNTKPLQGALGRRSSRVGGWRILFRVDEEASEVDVSDIGPRGQIYRGL